MNRRDLVLGAAALAACVPAESGPPPAPFPMRRGVNLGNALEAPNEGEWGYRIEDDHLRAIRDAGFDGVRLPVRWDAHAATTAPYTIAPEIMLRVGQLLIVCQSVGLKVQLDCHHYDALIAMPDRERARYLAIWRQIASMYRNNWDGLLFEPLNEPNGPRWDGAALRRLQADALSVIRETNPTRLVVFGGGNWNSLDGLLAWTPPAGLNIAATFHYYEPHDFTHQNAEWLQPNAPHFDRAWGTDADIAAIHRHMAQAAAWSRAHNIPLQLGEFGANARVPLAQRAAWTRTVREACDANAIAWCVWDFAGAFPIWDREAKKFIPEMLNALVR